jgi:ribonuclease D
VYIDTLEKLNDFVAQATHSDILALDTEFIRERTYSAKLCLIQCATEQVSAVIDPLAIQDLQPLAQLFENPNITKIIHASDQDCAIIYNEFGIVPKPLFDTQYAATLLGASHQISLANLVRLHCDVQLDKRDTFTDWLKRPLTSHQIEYALADVAYLPQIYRTMVAELDKLGRLSWLDEEFERISDAKNYQLDFDKLWHKVKGVQSFPPRKLALIQAVALWRERIAKRKNSPRRWVLSDEQIIEIVRREPPSVDDLLEVRGVREKLGEHWAKEVFSVLEKARALPEEQWPRPERGVSRGVETAASLDLMYALLRLRAQENNIAPTVLGNRDDLSQVIAGEHENVPILQGWRREIVGAELLDLLAGRLALHLEDNSVKVTLRELP